MGGKESKRVYDEYKTTNKREDQGILVVSKGRPGDLGLSGG